MSNNEELTQKFSTWGDKLLQHADVLHTLQRDGRIVPITVQLAPTEVCDSDCPFCSVAGRPIKSSMPFNQVEKCLYDFQMLGAKSIEITGGGNPLLYNSQGKNINDIIRLAHSLKLKIGIITNSHDLKYLNDSVHDLLSWVRVSLIQLDEGVKPEEYNFRDFPLEKLGFSYIIYNGTGGVPDSLSRTKKPYYGTTVESIKNIAKLVELNPGIKFVRIAGDCLIKGNNVTIKEQWQDVINEVDKHGKFFIKDIGNDDGPYEHGCYVGGIRPYIAANPKGGDYQVYICTSHVLNSRTYDLDYSLGKVEDVLKIWGTMSENLRKGLPPYEVKGNGGKNWCGTCNYCYYKFNNKLLHTVVTKLPDGDFA